MKRTALTLVALFVFSSAQAAPPNLSGRWTLDSHPRNVVLAIVQTADRLVVERSAGDERHTTTYRFDGSEVVTEDDGITIRQRSRWKDGALVTTGTQTRSMLGMPIELSFTEEVRLGTDGTLVVKTTMSGGGKERTRTSVYRRAASRLRLH